MKPIIVILAPYSLFSRRKADLQNLEQHFTVTCVQRLHELQGRKDVVGFSYYDYTENEDCVEYLRNYMHASYVPILTLQYGKIELIKEQLKIK